MFVSCLDGEWQHGGQFLILRQILQMLQKLLPKLEAHLMALSEGAHQVDIINLQISFREFVGQLLELHIHK